MRLMPKVEARLRIARPGTLLRNWVALYLQERREKRAAADVGVAPGAPSNLQGFDWGFSFRLTWDMTGVSGELGISVESRDADSADEFQEIATLGPGATFYFSGPATGDVECRIRAFNDFGYSPYSNTTAFNIA